MVYDAEHFFDGYKADSAYAMETLKAAVRGGAETVVLCDTNGGTLPWEVSKFTYEINAELPDVTLGIHAHNDGECGVANTLASVQMGARHIQGTINGYGERCGNANLTTIIPTLLLKEPYKSAYEIGVSIDGLSDLTRVSRMLDDVLNRVPNKFAAYVGAFACALLLDQPFGPVLVAMLVLIGGLALLFRRR